MITARMTNGDGLRTVDLAQCGNVVGQFGTTVWIDSQGRDEEIERFLRDHLKIHPLAIEDVFSDRMTPKVEDFGEYLYVVMHAVRKEQANPEALGTIELDVLIGPNWVFTHHSEPLPVIDLVLADLQRNPREMQRGPAFLAHTIIDHLTDLYLPVVDKFEEELDGIEEEVVERPRAELLQHLFALKRSLQRLRRMSVHQRDMLQRLSRGEYPQILPEALPFFRDVYDHFVRIADLADSYREMVTAALEIYMTVIANRTNDVMKALTLLSSVMLPLNFIAGLYGMNFENMPGQHTWWGYWMVLCVMVGVATVLYWQFKRRRFL